MGQFLLMTGQAGPPRWREIVGYLDGNEGSFGRSHLGTISVTLLRCYTIFDVLLRSIDSLDSVYAPASLRFDKSYCSKNADGVQYTFNIILNNESTLLLSRVYGQRE